MTDCPACKIPMIILEHERVEVDRCLECGGTWLDAGELARILEMARAETGPLTEALARAPAGKRADRRCPRCRARLRLARLDAEKGAVEADRCPRGHGLWLDRGEMRTLLQIFSKTDPAVGYLGGLFADEFANQKGK